MKKKKEFIRRDLTGDGFKNELQQIYPHYEVLDTYIDQNTEISIRCIKHNIIFKTTPRVILRTTLAGCSECIKLERSKEFIKFLEKNHPNIDSEIAYSNYINYTTPINLVCKLHPEESIFMSPAKVMKLGRSGKLKEFLCKSCKEETTLNRKLISWIDKFNIKFPKHSFDFSKSSYKVIHTSSGKSVAVIDNVFCKKCGSYFSTKAHILQSSNLCPCCETKSHGEIFVEDWLKTNNIIYKSQVRISHKIIQGKFENSDVIIDFSLNYNGIDYWIEYNGEQHYTWCKHLQTLEKFEGQLRRDSNIRSYCKENNIILIEVPYKFRTRESIWDLLSKIILGGELPNNLISLPEINYNRGGKRDEQ